MAGQFLPDVPVSSIVWAYSDVELNWYAAQGDDLKNQRPTIELNLVKIARDHNEDVEKVAQALIDNWLAIYIVFCTRQDLINKQARGLLGAEGEDILAEANLKVIKASPRLAEHYTKVAIEAIRGAKPVIMVPSLADLFQRVLEHLDSRLALMEVDATLQQARAEKYLRDIGLLKEEL